jgi:hypothetical protein
VDRGQLLTNVLLYWLTRGRHLPGQRADDDNYRQRLSLTETIEFSFSHSSDKRMPLVRVNRRTGPSASLLWRTPIRPSGRSATSTQLLLEKLRELLIQNESRNISHRPHEHQP